MELNFFKFQSSNYLKSDVSKKLYFILIAKQSIKIFFIAMMIMNNI